MLGSGFKMEGCRHQQAHSSKGIEAFSLISRLKRIFLSSKTAKDAQWHKLKRTPVENELSHLADGKAWKHLNQTWLEFGKDARNIRLGLATYGFSPFGNVTNSYSM
jgi:alanine racemase